MEDVLKKISQYQLFNFLLSGTILAFMLSKTTTLNLLYDNLLLAIFVYYFMGLIISRLGSLAIEPLFKKMGVVDFVNYRDYLAGVKKDKKIDALSQENNTYRTLISMLLTYLTVYISLLVFGEHTLKQSQVIIGSSIGLILLFTLSYRKQTKYITRRVEAALEK